MPSIYRELAKKIQDEVPIKEVITERISGHKHDLLCPFHEDRTPGSFHYSNSKNIFKCFSCGEGGGPVKFVQKYDKISRKEAILRLSLQYGFIDKERYNALSNDPEFAINEVKSPGRKIPEVLKKNPDLQLHLAYSLVSKFQPLSPEDRQYLHNRNISDADIEKNHYFSFTGEDVSKMIIEELKKANIDENMLIGIPGFYKENDEIKMVSAKGIGIPLKNCMNQTVALQVRSNEPSNHRYYFFSSTEYEKGTSCGSVIDVVANSTVNNSRVYITEGHFKADKLARETGSFVLSLQGVTNIAPLSNMFDQFKAHTYEISEVCIALDSDMFTNKQVFKAAENLCSAINEYFNDSMPVSFLIWNQDFGKGIDDVIDAGNFSRCTILPQEELFDTSKERP